MDTQTFGKELFSYWIYRRMEPSLFHQRQKSRASGRVRLVPPALRLFRWRITLLLHGYDRLHLRVEGASVRKITGVGKGVSPRLLGVDRTGIE